MYKYIACLLLLTQSYALKTMESDDNHIKRLLDEKSNILNSYFLQHNRWSTYTVEFKNGDLLQVVQNVENPEMVSSAYKKKDSLGYKKLPINYFDIVKNLIQN